MTTTHPTYHDCHDCDKSFETWEEFEEHSLSHYEEDEYVLYRPPKEKTLPLKRLCLQEKEEEEDSDEESEDGVPLPEGECYEPDFPIRVESIETPKQKPLSSPRFKPISFLSKVEKDLSDDAEAELCMQMLQGEWFEPSSDSESEGVDLEYMNSDLCPNTLLGCLIGGARKRKKGRQRRTNNGETRGGRKRVPRAMPPMGTPLSRLITNKETFYGSFTQNAAAYTSNFVPLTAVGSASGLGGLTLDNSYGETNGTLYYDQYRVISARVRVEINNNETHGIIAYIFLTNQLPVANAAGNYQYALGPLSSRKYLTEHSTLSAAWMRKTLNVNCPSIFGNPRQYVVDANTAASCNATSGPPPAPNYPNNNIYLVIGAVMQSAGTNFSTAGINFNIEVTKVVRYFEPRRLPG